EELLGTLLDISRLDAGALQPERRDVSLGGLFELLRVEFSPLAARKGLELRILPTTLTAHSDRSPRHRVLQHLLPHAIPDTQAGRIVMGVRRAGASLEVQVWDTGYGIAPEVQGLVFEEFHRFAPAPGAEHGLGLGLSIVQRISRILGHEVRLRSTLG